MTDTKRFAVLVFGGRSYSDTDKVFKTLDHMHAERPITEIIEGGATGADRLARVWAVARGVPFRTFHANWKVYGPTAGPRRNATMLTEGKPDFAVGFRGGRGTEDMLERLEARGIHYFKEI